MATCLRWARIIRPASQNSIFNDPAWDTLLELYLDVDQHPHCTVSDMASRTGVASSTTQRWLALLEQAGYVQDLAEHDAGFALSALGFETMNKYFDTLLSETWRLGSST
jgi:DNA-binding transcriptional ArsR family regulator